MQVNLDLVVENNVYRTRNPQLSMLGRIFPSLFFYSNFIRVVVQAGSLAKNNNYHDNDWVTSSRRLLRYLEAVGVEVEFSGINHITDTAEPCVIIGNHMSLLETILLPAILQPIKPITYVIKQSLLEYPVFKYVMRSRNPVAVTRTNPRYDLKTVMEEGADRLHRGISLIVFPQTTRSHTFDPNQMSSIGVKLAKAEQVPIIPLALKTDCMENGRLLKDFGKINSSRKVYFAFGAPMRVAGKGTDEQRMISEFITAQLTGWQHDKIILVQSESGEKKRIEKA